MASAATGREGLAAGRTRTGGRGWGVSSLIFGRRRVMGREGGADLTTATLRRERRMEPSLEAAEEDAARADCAIFLEAGMSCRFWAAAYGREKFENTTR